MGRALNSRGGERLSLCGAVVLTAGIVVGLAAGASDPFVQQGPKLTGRNEIASLVTGQGRFGFSAALSSDGKTALIGGYADHGQLGAAWVFVRAGSTWKQQGPKLTGSNEIGPGGQFGYSVALSADGNTALIGGDTDRAAGSALGNAVGAAWVFTRSGGTWKQQGPKLVGGRTGHQSQAGFGMSVALSADGNTALIGAGSYDDDNGAAFVFTRSGEAWRQQGTALTVKGGVDSPEFGTSVALAGNGNTAVIGSPGVGAAWVFTRSGEAWRQGMKLAAGGERKFAAQFGSSVALASDGNTALVGGFQDGSNAGAAWVFTRSGATWVQVTKLSAKGGSPNGTFGFRVALSADAKTAVITGPGDKGGLGAAWVFTRSASTWTELDPKLTPRGAGGAVGFGYSVALSSDAKVALIGAPGDRGGIGAAWVNVQHG